MQRIANWRNLPFFSTFTLQHRLRCKTTAPAVLARRRPFCFAPHSDLVLDPHSPTVCDDVRSFLKYKPFESVPLEFWSLLDSIAIRRALRVSAVQFRGAITRWNFIRQSWVNRRETIAKLHAWWPLWHLDVPVCSLCGFGCGRRQRLLLPLQHAKCSAFASKDLQVQCIVDAVLQCDVILEKLHILLAKVSG